MIVDVIRALANRWYLTLLGLLLTAAMAWGAHTAAPPSYEASGLVLMLPSKSAASKAGNPLLVLDSLGQPAAILVAHYGSDSARQRVASVSSTADFTVLLDDSIRGPVIRVNVKDQSAESTMAVLNGLMADLPKQLDRLQRQVGATNDSYLSSMTLSVDTAPEVSNAATLRLMIAAVLLGLVGTVLATSSFDSFFQGNRRRRSRPTHRAADPEPMASPEEAAPRTLDRDTSEPLGHALRRRTHNEHEAAMGDEQVGAGHP